MLFRGLALASALLIPAPVAPANVQPLSIISPDSVVQVVCYKSPYIISGSAFRIGGLYLSVKHVTSSGACYIGGHPIRRVYTSPSQDFSMLSADDGPFIPIDCGGFIKGRKYLAIGFARGVSPATIVEMTATGVKSGPWSILSGMLTVIPGMSGGALIDEETGKAVGTVNVEDFEEGWSGSLSLSDTPICKKWIA